MKMIGITDEVTTCECCGRKNLKRTVVLGSDAGTVYYGTECAAAALSTTRPAVEKMVRDTVKAAEKKAYDEQRAKDFAEQTAYWDWIKTTFPDGKSNLERARAWRASRTAV